MITRSVEQWEALFKQHDESGLNLSHFCRENNLCPKYFSKHKKDLSWFSGKLTRNDRQTTSPKWVKLKRATASVVEKPMSVTSQTANGADVSAVLYSIIDTAKANGLIPF